MPSKPRRTVARKPHWCDGCSRQSIQPGHVYLRITVFPGDDASGWDKPVTLKECGFCAERYDREGELQPVPEEQDHAIYLNAMREGRG